ncbi:MarR family transcriptional regulator [Flavihumibacter sp. R14]|nr:MarR family transcriptional regulator [Flavihumibacter soli]
MNEPLAQSLISVTKKYLSSFSKEVPDLAIDRYHHVLVLIDDQKEKLSQQALAELLQIDKSYMVTILDYLTEKGYVRREKNPNDRREQLIKLTPLAQRDVPLIRDAICTLNSRSLKNLTTREVQTFNAVLRTIQKNLNCPNPESMFNLKNL